MPPFVGPSVEVLHPVAGEHLERAVVAADRNGRSITARSGYRRRSATSSLDIRVLERLLELRDRHPEERRIPLECCLFDVERHGQQSLGGFGGMALVARVRCSFPGKDAGSARIQ